MKIPHHFPPHLGSVEGWTPKTKCSIFVQSCMYLYVGLDKNIEGVLVMGCRMKWENFIIIYLLLLIVKLFIQKLFHFSPPFLFWGSLVEFISGVVMSDIRDMLVFFEFSFSQIQFTEIFSIIFFPTFWYPCSYVYLTICWNLSLVQIVIVTGWDEMGWRGGETLDSPPGIGSPLPAMSASKNGERIKYLMLLRHAFHVDK